MRPTLERLIEIDLFESKSPGSITLTGPFSCKWKFLKILAQLEGVYIFWRNYTHNVHSSSKDICVIVHNE